MFIVIRVRLQHSRVCLCLWWLTAGGSTGEPTEEVFSRSLSDVINLIASASVDSYELSALGPLPADPVTRLTPGRQPQEALLVNVLQLSHQLQVSCLTSF